MTSEEIPRYYGPTSALQQSERTRNDDRSQGDALTVMYGEIVGVRDISLTVGAGEAVSLIGSERRRQDDRLEGHCRSGATRARDDYASTALI